jgi:ParB/RepB/Spo0J family partition protein
MPSRKDPTLDEIRARVAKRDAAEAASSATTSAPEDNPTALAAASARFYGSVEQLIQSRSVQRIPIGHIAPDIRPEMRQPRLLPLPEDLLANGTPLPEYRDLVADLHALGQSLKERQIQPIVVYAGASGIYPAVRYLILIGHRRWTGARLAGLEALDAIVVDPPTSEERVRLQYIENDEREDFSDMERAWALQQMRQALGENATWEEVETRLKLSNARRNQLTRLLVFKPSQQLLIARLHLQETQVRALHTAVRNRSLAQDHVDAILNRLAEIAIERSVAAEQAPDTIGAGTPLRRTGIDGPTVARLVARAQRALATTTDTTVVAPTPRWLPLLMEQIAKTTQGVQRAIGRVESLGASDTDILLSGVGQLVMNLTELTARVQSGARQATDPPDELHA